MCQAGRASFGATRASGHRTADAGATVNADATVENSVPRRFACDWARSNRESVVNSIGVLALYAEQKNRAALLFFKTTSSASFLNDQPMLTDLFKYNELRKTIEHLVPSTPDKVCENSHPYYCYGSAEATDDLYVLDVMQSFHTVMSASFALRKRPGLLLEHVEGCIGRLQKRSADQIRHVDDPNNDRLRASVDQLSDANIARRVFARFWDKKIIGYQMHFGVKCESAEYELDWHDDTHDLEYVWIAKKGDLRVFLVAASHELGTFHVQIDTLTFLMTMHDFPAAVVLDGEATQEQRQIALDKKIALHDPETPTETMLPLFESRS